MALLDLLPASEGMLPKWQLFVASMAIWNSLQNFFTLSITRKIYTVVPHQVTPLQARSVAMWTFTAALIRIYCAYNINNKAVYDMTMWSYVIALGHYTSELAIFRSADVSAAILGPFIVAPASLIWMLTQYTYYVKP